MFDVGDGEVGEGCGGGVVIGEKGGCVREGR